jgi:hypothetical protein
MSLLAASSTDELPSAFQYFASLTDKTVVEAARQSLVIRQLVTYVAG